MEFQSIVTAQINGLWSDGAIIVNPVNGALLADTGQLAQGDQFVSFMINSTVASVVRVAQRDVGNTTDIHSFDISIPANAFVPFSFPTKLTTLLNQRFRATIPTGVTGNVQVSIVYATIHG